MNMNLFTQKAVPFVLLLLLSSCGFSERGPNSNVRHTFGGSPFASVAWSKDNIMTFIDGGSSTLVSAPNRIIALTVQPKALYAFDTLKGNIIWKQNGVAPSVIAVHNEVLYTSDLNTIRTYNTASGKGIWKVKTPHVGQFLTVVSPFYSYAKFLAFFKKNSHHI